MERGSATLRSGRRRKPASARRTAQTSEAAVTERAARAPLRRLASAALVAILGSGSLGLWTIVPAGWLWIASRVSEKYLPIYLIALVGCPLTMLLWGWGLYRINRVYLRVSGQGHATEPTNWQQSAGTKRPMMLLDVLLTASAALALIALFVWFFFLAHEPTSTPIPDEFSGQGP